jgi:OOP family OmpA-OmpF porin
MNHRLAIALALVLAAPAARAEFLIGASVGQTNAAVDDQISFDADGTGWKVFVGFRFFKFLGIEGGYRDFGSPGTSLAGVSAEVEPRGVDVYGVGVLPIKKLELWAKIGLIYWDETLSVTGAGTPQEDDDSGTDGAFGFGIAWKFADWIALRGEWEEFDLGAADDVRFLSVGVDFRF